MLASLFLNYLGISLTTSLLVVGLLLLTPWLRKHYTAKWTYWIWLALAIRLLLPFHFSMNHPVIDIRLPDNTAVHSTVLGVSPANLQVQPPAGTHPVQVTAQSNALSLSSLSIMAMIWAGGAVIFLIYHAAGYFTFRKQALRWSRPISSKQADLRIKRILTEMKLPSSISVLTSEKVPNPMLVGFRKPLLLLPHEQFTGDEWDFIIRHELVHYKRHDMLYKLLLLVVHALHWFNPFVWLLVREASRVIELYCDDTVVKKQSLAYRKQYCESILSVMQKSDPRFPALSTNFLGGKHTMNQRFHSILSMKKRRSSLALFCTVVLLLGVLAACTNVTNGSNISFKPGTIYSNLDGKPVISYDAGNSYSVSKDGRVTISYRNGEVTAQTPLQLNINQAEPLRGISGSGFFISEDKTAILYNPQPEQLSQLHVLISDDTGKTWNDYIVPGAAGNEFFIGFTSQKEGWLVSGHSSGVGNASNTVFQTADGGKTWEEIGNPNDIYREHLTGVGFADKDTGFFGFRYYKDAGPEIYWTKDRGKSWSKLIVKLPEKFEVYNKSPLSAVFNGKSGKLPILLSDHEAGIVGTIYLSSKDGGQNWEYNEADDKLISQ